jgi:hypothetical protein
MEYNHDLDCHFAEKLHNDIKQKKEMKYKECHNKFKEGKSHSQYNLFFLCYPWDLITYNDI